MARLLTTSEIAELYGVADSTVRHYRASGRLVPSRKTPGGHARYTIGDVIAALGDPATLPVGEGAAPQARIIGMERKSFAPAGQHDLRSSHREGVLAADVVALGRRELREPVELSRYERPRWGGRLLRARDRVSA